VLLLRKWPAGFDESAISAAIYGTVRPDVDMDPGPPGLGPNAMPFASVVPIELHEELVVGEDMPGAAGGFTWVDLAFCNVILNVQDIAKTPLPLVRKMKTHARYGNIPKDDWAEHNRDHPAPEMPFRFISRDGHVRYLPSLTVTLLVPHP